MKTRAEIYGNEATDLLRIVTMYPGLCEHQLLCFHPGKEDTTKALLSHLRKNGERIKESIRNQTYKPMPVKRVEIPKEDGSKRKLGIPTVTDQIGRASCRERV